MRKWLIDYRGNMKQEEVAKRAKISRGAYSNIENGKRDPSVEVAKRIANVLGFNWYIFFDDDVVKTKQRKTTA